MKCPVCGERSGVELDAHSDGFTKDPMKECAHCGSVWTANEGNVDVIVDGRKQVAAAI